MTIEFDDDHYNWHRDMIIKILTNSNDFPEDYAHNLLEIRRKAFIQDGNSQAMWDQIVRDACMEKLPPETTA